MTIKTNKLIFLLALIAYFLLISSSLMASEIISLTDNEKKLIDQGEIIVREVETVKKEGKTFEAIGYINASKTTIIKVLTEYEKYPDFMPNISHVKIVEKKGNAVILNYTLTLPLKKIKKYRLKISVSEPEEQSALIQWELLKWPELKPEETIKDTTGYWRIEEKTQNSSLVLYHVYTDPGPIPFGLGWIVDVLSKNSVPDALLQTKNRAEKMVLTNASNEK